MTGDRPLDPGHREHHLLVLTHIMQARACVTTSLLSSVLLGACFFVDYKTICAWRRVLACWRKGFGRGCGRKWRPG